MKKKAEYVGINNYDFHHDEKYQKILFQIKLMINDNNINGIIVQLPLPQHLNKDKY